MESKYCKHATKTGDGWGCPVNCPGLKYDYNFDVFVCEVGSHEQANVDRADINDTNTQKRKHRPC